MLLRRSALQGLLALPFLMAGNGARRSAAASQAAATGGAVTLSPSADSSGVTDTTNINSALSANLAVYLSPGQWYINEPLTPPSGTALFGLGTSPPLPSGALAGAVINVVSAFTGSAAISLSGVQDVAIRDLTIDGATGPSGAVDGLLLSGATADIRLEDLLIQSVTGVGVATSATGGNTVHARNVTVHQAPACHHGRDQQHDRRQQLQLARRRHPYRQHERAVGGSARDRQGLASQDFPRRHLMNDAHRPLARSRPPRGFWRYLPVIAAAGAALTACSGSPAATSAAKNSALAGTKPVIFNVDTVNGAFFYSGIRPTSIDLTLEDEPPGSNVAAGLTWTSWPSGPGGVVAASSTVTGTGKIKTTVQPVSVTLSDPSNGKPSFWQTLTERVHGQQPTVYHFYGKWALKASGGQQMP